MCTSTGLLVRMSRIVPGNRYDIRVMWDNLVDLGLWHMNGAPQNDELAKVMASVKNMVDKGFGGMEWDHPHPNWRVPHKGRDKKSPKEIGAAFESKDDAKIATALGLVPEQYAENRVLSSRRYLMECVIGMLKRWEILPGPLRGAASQLNRQFNIVGGILNLGILWPEIERNEAPMICRLMERRVQYHKRR